MSPNRDRRPLFGLIALLAVVIGAAWYRANPREKPTPSTDPSIEVLSVRRLQGKSLQTLAVSPLTSDVAMSCREGGVLVIRDTDATATPYFIRGTPKSPVVNTLIWSSTNQLLAGGHTNGTVSIWNTQTGKIEVNQRVSDQAIRALAWSPDGEILACSDGTSTITLLPLLRRKMIKLAHQSAGSITALAWSPNSYHLAASSQSQGIVIWRFLSRIITLRQVDSSMAVSHLAWSPTSDIIAAAYTETVQLSQASTKIGRVGRWAADTGEFEGAIEAHSEPITGLAWTPDGYKIWTSSQNGELKDWLLATPAGFEPGAQTGRTDKASIIAMAYDARGNRIFAATRKGIATMHVLPAGDMTIGPGNTEPENTGK